MTTILQWAQPIVIQDCANLAKALKEKGVNRTYLGHIVKEIKEMMREDRELVIDVIKRANNRVAASSLLFES